MEKKQSPVDYLVTEIENIGFSSNNTLEFYDTVQVAKEMEEEQNQLELPTDEEIDAYAKSTGYYGHCTDEFREGIELGAKWMRDKIKGGNNE